MPKVLNDGQVEYPKDASGRPQAPETVAQYSKDVTAFMMWAAEPHQTERKMWGFIGVIFLTLLASLLYLTNKRLWAPIKDEAKRG